MCGDESQGLGTSNAMWSEQGVGNSPAQLGLFPYPTPPPVTIGGGQSDIMAQIKALSKYSGKTKWGPFYRQFESIADINDWGEAERMFALN